MGGDAQGAGMGNPLPIDEEQIWASFQPGKCFQQGRGFAKGEKAGNLGKRDFSLSGCFFQKHQVRV